MHRDRRGAVPDHVADLIDHRRVRLVGGADPLRQHQPAVDSMHSSGLSDSAVPSQAAAPPIRPLRRRLSSRCTTMKAWPRGTAERASASTAFEVGTRRGRARGRQRDEADTHRRRPRVDHRTAGPNSRAAATGGAVGARQRRRDVHGHHPVAAAVGQRLGRLGEFGGRGARGGGVARRGCRAGSRRHRRAGPCRPPGCAAAPGECRTARSSSGCQARGRIGDHDDGHG